MSGFVLEGEGVVSTAAVEIRASVDPDGSRIVWGSPDRTGGPGGWDLWQAERDRDGWVDAAPLPFDTDAKEFDPIFSADGRWLYFFSDRPGGVGGDDLYRVAVVDDGWGPPENLGPDVNTPGDEWAPTPSADGRALLFASDRHGSVGRHDLFQARWDGHRFQSPAPVPGVNTPEDEFDAAWLDGGRGLVFARSADVDEQPIRLWLARCDGEAYVDAAVWEVRGNPPDGAALGPVAVGRRSLLISGADPELRVGKLDIYRVTAPKLQGSTGCTP